MNLKPCPFCGGEAEVEREGTSRQSCIIDCADCGCRLESNEIGAGDAWNRRSPIPEPREGKPATCGECQSFRCLDAGGTGCACVLSQSVYVLAGDKACAEGRKA